MKDSEKLKILVEGVVERYEQVPVRNNRCPVCGNPAPDGPCCDEYDQWRDDQNYDEDDPRTWSSGDN